MQGSELDRLVGALDDGPVGELSDAFCSEVASLIGVTDCSFAVIGAAGQRHTLGASSERAKTLDRWQFTLDQGPCLLAAQTGEVTSSTVVDAPWPELAEKARDLGYSAVAGVPLAVAGVRFGALNLQMDAGPVPADALERAVTAVEQLSPALLDHLAAGIPATAATSDRSVIHQATGIVAGQLGVSVEDALAALRARAWSDDTLLDHLADGVVRGDVRLDRP